MSTPKDIVVLTTLTFRQEETLVWLCGPCTSSFPVHPLVFANLVDKGFAHERRGKLLPTKVGRQVAKGLSTKEAIANRLMKAKWYYPEGSTGRWVVLDRRRVEDTVVLLCCRGDDEDDFGVFTDLLQLGSAPTDSFAGDRESADCLFWETSGECGRYRKCRKCPFHPSRVERRDD